MIKLLQKLFNFAMDFTKKSKLFGIFYPLIEATDAFFFGPEETAKEAPYIRDSMNLKRFMITVVIALAPATLAGIYFYGLRVLGLIIISYIFGIGTEVIFSYYKKEEISEGAFVTCLIYPLILPPTLPYWMAAVGIVVGIFFGKAVFGGTGHNIFNPAIVGRIFVAVAFPVQMTSVWLKPLSGFFAGIPKYSTDLITSATPLITHKANGALANLNELFWGNIPGCVGETSKLLIILGGFFLIYTKVASWRTPLAYLGSFTILSILGHTFFPEVFAPTLFQLLSGGLLFAAFFMCTDPVTCPFTAEGKWAFGIGLGLLTLVIRVFSGFVESVMFALIFMNTFSPFIDELVLARKYKKQ